MINRITNFIECNDEYCKNVEVDGNCYFNPNFFCTYKLKQKLQELIDNNSINITNPSNTYESINVIPVDEIYKFMEELE